MKTPHRYNYQTFNRPVLSTAPATHTRRPAAAAGAGARAKQHDSDADWSASDSSVDGEEVTMRRKETVPPSDDEASETETPLKKKAKRETLPEDVGTNLQPLLGPFVKKVFGSSDLTHLELLDVDSTSLEEVFQSTAA
jgi:hypothetical protein